MSRRKPTLVSLDELLDDATIDVVEKPRRPVRALLGFVAIAAALGLFAGALTSPAIVAADAATGSTVDAWNSLPSDLPIEQTLPQHTVLLDKDGNEFARFFSENRIDVGGDQISDNFKHALVATEDSRFYEHGGADVRGIARAMVKNVVGGAQEGASTITQQLVQNVLISNATTDEEREVAAGTSYRSKILEIRFASELEKQYTKDEILTMYANAVFLGNRAYGVQAAARVYFNTDAASLTVPQAALLVALLKSPIKYDPYVNPDDAKLRRDTVINRMVSESYLTADEAAAAKATPIELSQGTIASGCDASAYPYYCALVRDEILENKAFGKTAEERQETLRRGGLTLTTGLDRHAMDVSQTAVNHALGTDNRVAAGTAVIVPGTGVIAAVAQNRTWDQTQIVYAKSQFQPGSIMKPVTLAAALEQGYPLTTTFSSNGPYFSPSLDEPNGGFRNAGNEQPGTIDARDAVRKSINVYFVKLIEKTGVQPVADMAKRLGITTLPEMHGREASLALGTFEVTPLEMANVYSVFASGGIKCNPVAIVSGVRTSSGAQVPVSDADCHQELDPNIAALMDDALQGPFQAGGTLSTVGGPAGRPAGGKTGTTDNSGANWTAGMTPQYATVVWVGDPRGGQRYPLTQVRAYGRTLYNTFGASIAGPVWKEVMTGIHTGLPAAAFPAADPSPLRSIITKRVPDVRGMTTSAAVSALRTAGLKVTISDTTAPDDGLSDRDIVAGQSPAGGSNAGAENTITLTLSHGSDTHVQLPADQ
jgi:membrane peptidoglycan carboxypeptidase